MFCSSCGQRLPETARICPHCSAVNPYYTNNSKSSTEGESVSGSNVFVSPDNVAFESPDNEGFERVHNVEVIAPPPRGTKFNVAVFEEVLRRMNVSRVLWMILSIFMIVCGVLSLCVGYGVCPIILGIWNLVQCSREKRNIEFFRSHPGGMVAHFDGQQTSLIIAFFINLFFGALIGVAGIVYDMVLRGYVMEHKDELL